MRRAGEERAEGEWGRGRGGEERGREGEESVGAQHKPTAEYKTDTQHPVSLRYPPLGSVCVCVVDGQHGDRTPYLTRWTTTMRHSLCWL